MSRPLLKTILTDGYENSVFRRVGVLLAFLIPASLANFAVLYCLSHVLSAAEFGVFYVANTFGNVLFSGSLILNMFFSRHLVSVVKEHDETAAVATIDLIGRVVIFWGSLVGSAILIVMLLLSKRFGVQSMAVVPLIVLDAYTSYVADTGRAFFQSLRRTVSLGMYTLAWMTFRLVFCLIGVFIFRSAFGALSGVVASAAAVYCSFRIWARRGHGQTHPPSPLPSLKALLPSIAGYGLLTTVSNLDILLVYFILQEAAVGAYSASSIYPKAMLVVTLPLVQILFPGMMGSSTTTTESRRFALKSASAMFTVTTGGIFAIWLLSGFLCGGRWGVKLCDPSLLWILLVSVVPLSLLRVLVLLQFARHRDWVSSWLLVPAALYMYIVSQSHWDAHNLAIGFSAFTIVCLIFFVTVHYAAERSQHHS